MSHIKKAVILARGLGTRMQKTDDSVALSEAEAAVAAGGVKAMIPIDGERPFVDYVLSELADAGYARVCLVIGPEHGVVRDYYRQLAPTRVSVEFAIQAEPLGTADAVAAAEDFAAGEGILVINSDNYYPCEALETLRTLDTAGLAAFRRDGLIEGTNIPPERINKFAVIEIADGFMTRIIEKPSGEQIAALPEPICVSMNCWRFSARIFDACRAIEPSPRGELELTDAVQYAIDHLGERFAAPIFSAPVLDLSSRADIAPVQAALAGVDVKL
ncbi:MAG: sugar phosphate nucleotidyltransferase [Planctomycetota bacterium]